MTSQTASGIGLLGAGGQAREIATFAGRRVLFQAVHRQFVSSLAAVAIETPTQAEVDTGVVAAVGAPAMRRALVQDWPGTDFVTVVANTAFVASDVVLGEGTVVAPLSAVMASAVIGNHTIVNAGAVVSHDCVIGDYVTVSPKAAIGGGCTIGDGVFIGIGATVSNGVRIGAGAVVGAGALVLRDVADLEVVAGVPAVTLRLATDWLAEL